MGKTDKPRRKAKARKVLECAVIVRPNRIGVDTGCGHGPDHPLSAVVLHEERAPLRILDSRA